MGCVRRRGDAQQRGTVEPAEASGAVCAAGKLETKADEAEVDVSDKQATSRRQGPREGSAVWAMIQVLDGKRKPMTPTEVLKEIQKRGLAKKLSGKTPEASVAGRLAVNVGIYFERPEKGKYQLKKGITAKSVSSTTGPKPASNGASRDQSNRIEGRQREGPRRDVRPLAIVTEASSTKGDGMYRLRSVLGGEFDFGKEQVFDPMLTHILYWRDMNTTHFVTKDPQRGRLATAERAGIHWRLQRFLPSGDSLTDHRRTRHEADFAALMHTISWSRGSACRPGGLPGSPRSTTAQRMSVRAGPRRGRS